MSIKTKLTTAIMSLVLVLGLLSVGVYALNQAEVTLGGNLTFSATGVYAEVRGSVANAVMPEGQNAEYAPLLFSTDNTEPNQTSWQKTLGFDGTNDIVLTINIENKANDRKLYFAITDTIGEIANVTKTVKQGENDCLNTCIEVEAGNTAEIKITFHLKDVNLSLIDQSLYGYKIELNKDVIKEEEKYYTIEQWIDPAVVGEGKVLEFTIANGEASVGFVYVLAQGGFPLEKWDTSGDIRIPAYVKETEEGELIPVTSVMGGPCTPYVNACQITNISLPETITDISGFAFWEMRNLKEISLSSCLISIGMNAFEGCASLTEIRLPNSLNSIGADAFVGCNALTDIYYDGTEAQWNEISKANANIPTSVTIHFA